MKVSYDVINVEQFCYHILICFQNKFVKYNTTFLHRVGLCLGSAKIAGALGIFDALPIFPRIKLANYYLGRLADQPS